MSSKTYGESDSIVVGLTEAGLEYYRRVESAPPSRWTGVKAAGNKVVGHPSKKMGCLRRCESSLEHVAAITMELDPDVEAFYSQPEPVRIRKIAKSGRPQTVQYTPDFLMRKNEVIHVIEVKSIEAVRKYCEEKPGEWVWDEGRPVHIPAKQYFSSLGILHQVVTPDDQGQMKMYNLRLLCAASQRPRVLTDREVMHLLETLKQSAIVTIDDALKAVGLKDPLAIYQLIAFGVVYSPISKCLLDVTQTAVVSLCQTVGACLSECGVESPSLVTVSDITKAVSNLSPEQMKVAQERLEWMRSIPASARNRRYYRYKKAVIEGERNGLPPLLSLAPQHNKKGNRTAKIPDQVRAFMEGYVDEHYMVPAPKKRAHLYYGYRIRVEDIHPDLPAVSKNTFYKYLSTLDPVKVARAQKGRGAANHEKPASPVENRNIKPSIAFYEATIDHFYIDLSSQVLMHGDIKITGRLWLSAMVDRASQGVLAWYLSLRAPSSLNTGVLIRRCARQWGRIPLAIRTDRGADFTSVYHDALLAHLGVVKYLAPARDSRNGAEVERFFKEFISNWLQGRPGYVEHIANRRGVDRKYDPSNMAELTPLGLLEEITKFVDIRNSRPHGTRHRSPHSMFKEDPLDFELAGIPIKYDQRFIFDTAIDLRKFSFCRKRGVKINGMHYWCEDLSDPGLLRKQLEVRIEPEDPYTIYVFVGKDWLVAKAPSYQRFICQSELEKEAINLWVSGGNNVRRAAYERSMLEIARAQKTFDEERSASSLVMGDAEKMSYRPSNDNFLDFRDWGAEDVGGDS